MANELGVEMIGQRHHDKEIAKSDVYSVFSDWPYCSSHYVGYQFLVHILRDVTFVGYGDRLIKWGDLGCMWCDG